MLERRSSVELLPQKLRTANLVQGRHEGTRPLPKAWEGGRMCVRLARWHPEGQLTASPSLALALVETTIVSEEGTHNRHIGRQAMPWSDHGLTNVHTMGQVPRPGVHVPSNLTRARTSMYIYFTKQ